MPAHVKFFGLSTCLHCKKAKAYLEEQDIPYDCTLVDQLEGQAKQDCIAEVKKFNPSLSFPTIVIGDKVIVGFHQDQIDEALETK